MKRMLGADGKRATLRNAGGRIADYKPEIITQEILVTEMQLHRKPNGARVFHQTAQLRKIPMSLARVKWLERD